MKGSASSESGLAAVSRRFALPLLIIAVCFAQYGGRLGNSKPWVFQVRDIHRAIGLIHGQFLTYGPETTGGGNLFGPLYYALLAVPVLFGVPWTGAWYLMISLAAISAAWLFLFVRAQAGVVAAILASMFTVFSAWQSYMVVDFFNASYLIPFQVACTIYLCKTFLGSRADGCAWFLAFLSIGLGCQVHASIFLSIPGAITLQAAAPMLSLPRLTARQFLVGLLGLALPVLPYFLLSRGAGALGGTVGAVRSMATLVSVPRDELVTAWQAFPLRIVEFTPLAILIPAAFSYSRKLGQSPDGPVAAAKLTRIMALQCLVTAPSLLYYAFASNANRYQGPYSVSVAVLAALVIERCLSDEKRARLFNFACALLVLASFLLTKIPWAYQTTRPQEAVLCLVLLAGTYLALRPARGAAALAIAVALSLFLELSQPALVWSRLVDSPVESFPAMQGNLAMYEEIAQRIHAATGWSLEEARKRIYFVDTHVSFSLVHAYEVALERSVPLNPAAPSGYIVMLLALGFEPARVREVLLAKDIPQEVKSWIREGYLELGEPEIVARGYSVLPVIVPYRFRAGVGMPPYIQNFGYQYERIPRADLLEDISRGNVEKLHEKEWLFRWNECAWHGPACTTGALVRLEQVRPGRFRARVEVIGQPLSHPSEWTSPRWTEEWNEPFLELQCGSTPRRFRIADAIGRGARFARKRYGNVVIYANGLLAPFEREFELDCREGVRRVAVGRAGSTISDTELPAPFVIEAPTLSTPVE